MDSQINNAIEWFFTADLKPFQAVLIIAGVWAVHQFLEYCYGKVGSR